ncbi:MAG TPA: septum formation initiator family protein [Candidatus Janibacter merdipullorum]|nr:septum formation initiator family protein [Candidatus Janibacter merdipullorum]
MTTRRWVVLASVVALLLIMLVPTGKSWYDQRQRLAELNDRVATQKENVAELEREKELWETDAYVEAQARKRLKFVKPGEKTYTIVDPESTSPGVDPETGTVEGKTNQPWYEQMASSVETADDPATEQ